MGQFEEGRGSLGLATSTSACTKAHSIVKTRAVEDMVRSREEEHLLARALGDGSIPTSLQHVLPSLASVSELYSKFPISLLAQVVLSQGCFI